MRITKTIKPINLRRHVSLCRALLAFATIFPAGCSPGATAPEVHNPGIIVSQDAGARQLNIEWPAVAGVTSFEVKVDDSATLRAPIVTRTIRGRSVSIDVLRSGLAPGVPLYISVQPGGFWTTLKLKQASWKELLPQNNYLGAAWQKAGRPWLSRYSGVAWLSAQQKWQLDAAWKFRDTGVGPEAYYIEYAMRGGVQMALVNSDTKLIDELANFYTVYVRRFTTLGALRRKKSTGVSTSLLDNQGSDAAKTLPWIENTPSQQRVREHTLANSQFFHPAARLIRVISTLPQARRSAAMKNFVAAYLPIIVRDHLIRLAYEVRWNRRGAKNLPDDLIGTWRALADSPGSSGGVRAPGQNTMSDRDLWLIATAAEILGANANAPQLAPLDSSSLRRLREITQVGAELFQTRKTLYANTRDFGGRVVGSASYFNGDMDTHPTMAYARYSGAAFPTPTQKKPAQNASWDISHFYRVPVFLRSMYDNRKATNLDFPQARDIQLVTNQYVYRVFNSDFQKPLLSNFFDGSDGWFRVSYHDEAFGYPPSKSCGANSKRPCLTAGGIQGWALLEFFNDDLAKLQRSLVQMAASNDATVIAFRERHYTYNNRPFAFTDKSGAVQYPFLLFVLLSGMPERFDTAQEIKLG